MIELAQVHIQERNEYERFYENINRPIAIYKRKR